ncbi:type I-E CRISPR-associated protein Cse2/CasB [Actinomadura sp. ATCC 31491]|uniref:Type I-E CRISPR-associated protein Cse2/CasB n=1 Tax=Actinomadura luzonensis TaxID=2805427 RepID=A0ABT0FR34_9ACTN|nr:type I-E CRISPR-associated protein Cse2/CasB [Actinomadura luzonensis]MCK2214772.1 type I-E CRISPR-associated protein Cse2/CasB [Actinomadura luzonensis]
MAVSLETADKYVTYIHKKVTAPGSRAALRRSLGRPVDDAATRRAHSVVAAWLPSERTRSAVENAYYGVAAMIAAQPRRRDEQADAEDVPPLVQDESANEPEAARKKTERPSVSLGATLGTAVRDKKLNRDTVEARLHLLCRQDVSGLHRKLPSVVRQLATKEIDPDWGRLLRDLSRWEHDRNLVTKRWLQDFYRRADAPEPPNADDQSESEDQ